MTKQTLLFRAWYYFRLGYGTYVSFPLGFLSWVLVVWGLGVKNFPFLEGLFEHLWIFVALTGIGTAVTSIFFGWLHMKRSLIFSTEQDIGYEANPYIYQLPPGFQREAQYPVYLEIITALRMIGEQTKALTPENVKHLQELEGKIQILLEGGALGIPKAKGAVAHVRDTAKIKQP